MHWCYNIHGSPMFALFRKLKLLKRLLKGLNWLHLSYIPEKIARAEAILEEHQMTLHADKDN